MSNSLGSVVVELSANIAKFQSDMGKAAQIAEDRMKQIDKSIGLVKQGLGAIGVGFALGATFDKIKEKIEGAISSAAGLQQLSERTGSAVETLSGLVGIAKLSGTGLDELAGGLQKLGKAMVDAENGGAKTTAAFTAIGISVAEIKDKKPDQTFKLIADRLAEYQDGAEKLAIAQILLGKSGANLLPAMKDLAEVGTLQVKVTAEQAAAADEYEKNLLRLKAGTDAIYKTIGIELIPVFNAFTKALLETQTANNGVKKGVEELAKDGSLRSWAETAVTVVGLVIDAFDGVYRVVQIVGKGLGALAAAATFAVTGEFATAKSVMSEYAADVDKILMRDTFSSRLQKQLADSKGVTPATARAKINASGLGGDDAKGPKDDPTKKILEGKLKVQEDFIASERNLLQTRQQYLDFFAGLEYTTKAEAEQAKQKLIADNLIATQSAYDKEIADLTLYIARAEKVRDKEDGKNKREDVIRKRSEAEKQANKEIGDSQNRLLAIRTKFELGTKEQARANQISNESAQIQIDLMGESSLAVQQLTAARQIQLALDERIYQLRKEDANADVSQAQEEAAAQIIRSNRLIEASYMKQTSAQFGASEAIRKYGEDAANVGQQIEGALTNAFRGAEDALVQFAMTGKLSFGDLAKSILADLTRIQAKNLIASLVGDGKSGAGGIIGSLFSGIAGARADGGPVNGGSTYIVGERGPEVFTAPTAGNIVPNHALQGGASGGNVTVENTYHIDSRTDQSTIAQMLERNKAQTKADIKREMQRSRTAYSRA